MSVSRRVLGRSGIAVSAIGLGCNAIGGPYWDTATRPDLPVGYGQVDDAESIRAIQRAVGLGITFFDTADEYGCGHSEKVLGQALADHREQVVISTKFGYTFDETSQTVTGKFTVDTLPSDDDIRSLFFKSSAFTRDISRLESLKAILTAGGRSLAQGALAWVLARHPQAVPIPGFRTAWQVEQNAAVLTQGPLPETSLQQIKAWLQDG